jgi:Nucleotidyltransferase domain
MDLARPMSVVTPTLDGDVLAVLAGGRGKLTGRQIARMIGASQEGVRRSLQRLVRQGIALDERAGAALLFQLNRQHIAAPYIEGLAFLRLELIRRLREKINEWEISPVSAVLFGSVARGDATTDSDLDIAVIRPANTDADEPGWRDQIVDLEAHASALTGNDTRVLEYSQNELKTAGRREPVLRSAAREGIELFGSRAALLAPAKGGPKDDQDNAVRSRRHRRTQEKSPTILRPGKKHS